MFESEVTRPYSWWVKERMKWRLIWGGKKAMINDKSSVPVTNEAYDDKNHEDDISSDGRHGV